MKNNLHVFLGATVADAAARPLHWVYNQKKLNSYIKGKKDFSFLKENKSPFYNIKTGKVSGYNDVGQVMFKTLLDGDENLEKKEEHMTGIVARCFQHEFDHMQGIVFTEHVSKLKLDMALKKRDKQIKKAQERWQSSQN